MLNRKIVSIKIHLSVIADISIIYLELQKDMYIVTFHTGTIERKRLCVLTNFLHEVRTIMLTLMFALVFFYE